MNHVKNHKLILPTILIIFLYSASILTGQELVTQHITIGEGLSNVNANTIHQDKYGFLWIGTDDGLNRYDGYNFKVYKSVPGNNETLIDNEVWDIAEDKNANLWIATRGGISFFNRSENRFLNYDLDTLTAGKPAQFPKAVSIFVDSKDNVWSGSIWGGIIKYNKDENMFERVEVKSDRRADFDAAYRMVERDGQLYANHFGYGIVKYNPIENYFEVVELKGEEPLPNYANQSDRISKLFIDHSNQLWVVSDWAIRKIDLETNEIRTVVKFKTNNVFNLWMVFTGLAQDTEGNVWIGKDIRGIYKFDGISDDYTFIPFGEEYTNNPNTYAENIRSMITDNTGILWIGTFQNGLFKYDPASEPFIWYKHDNKDPNSLSGNEVFGLYQSKTNDNLIYVGTRGAGLNKFNPETGNFNLIKLKFQNDAFGGSVRSILENQDGSLYLGTWGDGFYKYSEEKGFNLISKYDSSNNASIPGNLVRILKEDDDGKVWIGTTEGLSIYDPVYSKVERIYTNDKPEYPQGLLNLIKSKYKSGDILAAIRKPGNDENITESFSIERPRDYLIVSAGEGLSTREFMVDYGWLENEKGEVVWSSKSVSDSYFLGGDGKNRITASNIRLNAGKYNLRYKSDDSHSFGKWNSEAPVDSNYWGIQIVNLSNEEFAQTKALFAEEANKFRVSGSNIWSIVISRSNNNYVWIGYGNEGFDRYDKYGKGVKYYRYDPKNPNSLSNNTISDIYEDDKGILWIGTNVGLNRFDPKTEQFEVYTETDGLPTNYISSILEDQFGNLWISTRNGLSRMTISDGRPTFVNYDSEDGLGGVDFISLVSLKASSGKLYFGGEHGLNEIIPGSINTTPPDLLITDLKLGSKSVSQMGKDSPLHSSIYEVDRIELNYDQNDISFEFAALHFARAEKNQYAHKLEGYDDEWHYDNRKFAAYTNLDPGEYKFIFRGSNSEGVWNDEGKSLLIKIFPPWWQTTWAYIGYGLLFVGFIFGVDRIQRRRLLAKVREKRKLEEAESRAATAELQAKATEAEKRVIEAEYIHKKKELEEARELQLSMLPESLPQLPHLDIAVYMRTATEVGGDYYDFHVGLDGTLTVVLGDATGHGMKAGTMVTAVKGLFNSYSSNPDILYSFHEISRCIKQMRLGKLSMCMTMLKINNDKMIMSAAGMPPIMIFKNEDNTTSEEMIKGMPLGTFDNYPYDVRELKLNKGDTILLMSDGLPELTNSDDEQFGYQKVRNEFENNAAKTPEQIIDQLKKAGEDWNQGREPDDDITFVVIKVK